MALLTVKREENQLITKGTENSLSQCDPFIINEGEVVYSLKAGWSVNTNGIDLFSDRLGMIPLFIYQQPDLVSISDSLRELVGVITNPRIDFDALAVFLRLGFFIGNDTPVYGVKVLPPATSISITPEAFNFDLDSSYSPVAYKAFPGSRIDAIEMYDKLFRRALCERLVPGKLLLPLSGGRDSRHILLECVDHNRPPDCVVTSKKAALSGLEDVEVASLLCEMFNLKQVVTEYDSSRLFADEVIKNEMTHHLSDEHGWYLSVLEILKQEGADLLLDGIGGDVLSNGLFFDQELLHAFHDKDLSRAAEIVIGSRGELPYLTSELRHELCWDRAAAHVKEELTRHRDSLNPIRSFYFWNRTRREISLSPICMAAQVTDAGMPYLAPELVDFFFSLPVDCYGPPGFHDEVIAYRYAQSCTVRYEKSLDDCHSTIRFRGEWRSAVSYFSQSLPGPYTSRKYLIPRLARMALSGDYQKESWFLSRLVYLDGLEQLGISIN